ncbi:MFS transporter [Gordonia jinhuaensis]|uniref:Transporter n=2 Tax=Gordonia jinhuaensis TaxID=1517702 RepID=A0A916THU6_9ACTN|nr:putative transporter [Gordonia jinhuaensis]
MRPFAYRQYRLLCLGLMLTLFSDGVYLVGQVWQVIHVGGGPSQLAMVTVVFSVGMVVSTLLGGVLADRFSQRLIIIWIELLKMVAAFTVGTLALTGHLQIWHLMLAGLLFGVAEGVYYPTYSALLPALIPQRDLFAANGVEGTARPILYQGIGPAVGGALVSAAAPGLALLGAGVANVLALVVYLRMDPVPVQRDLSDETRHPIVETVSDIAEGFRYMWQTRWLMATLTFACVTVLMTTGPLEVLVPFAIKDQAGGDAGDHSLVLAAYGIGAALGSIVVVMFPFPRRYLSWLMGIWAVAGLPLLLMGVATHVWTFVCAGLLLGFLFNAPDVLWGTLLQSRIPRHMLGRIAGLDAFVSVALMPVSMALAAPMSHALGLTTTMILAALVPIPFGAVLFVWARIRRDEVAHPIVTSGADVDDEWQQHEGGAREEESGSADAAGQQNLGGGVTHQGGECLQER